MNEPPARRPLLVLALDDDPAQRPVLVAALHGLAEVRFFSLPQDAVSAAGQDKFDVAILDVHLRRSVEDGIDVARRIRQTDPDLAVILYTGDESPAVLESALDVRALRRLLKASGKQAIIAAVQTGAAETASRRHTSAQAIVGREALRHLEDQGRTVELTRTMTDVYRGFFREIANELTALGVTAAAFGELTARLGAGAGTRAVMQGVHADLLRVAAANTASVGRLAEASRQMESHAGDLTNFENRAQVTSVLRLLERVLATDDRVSGRLKITPPLRELVLPVSAIALLNGLRNMAFFLIDAGGPQAALEVRVSVLSRGEAEVVLSHPRPTIVVNRSQLHAAEYVRFSLCCIGASFTLARLDAALAGPPAAGELHAVANLTALLSGAAAFQQTSSAGFGELLFPTW